MDELTYDILIKAKYAGNISAISSYISLALQTTAIIIGGIILWRMSTRLHRKKQEARQRNRYFETPFSKGWKGRS